MKVSSSIRGGVSTQCRIEKKEENTEGTRTSKHPNGYPPLDVFEKAATKKDDHNHPNSLQRVNCRKENMNRSKKPRYKQIAVAEKIK